VKDIRGEETDRTGKVKDIRGKATDRRESGG